MPASAIYCAICGGPAADDLFYLGYMTAGDDHRARSDVIVREDVSWLKSCVAVYADCMTPPGSYEPYEFCLRVDGRNDERTPEWIPSLVRPGQADYRCDYDGNHLAHELCAWLAAAWSRSLYPARFPSSHSLDPARFFWTKTGPTCEYICDAWIEGISTETIACMKASATAKADAGAAIKFDYTLPLNALKHGYAKHERVSHGYSPDALTRTGAWLRGCTTTGYAHQKSYGVAHLRRPDRFPDVHPAAGAHESRAAVFAPDCPLDIELHILARVEDAGTLRALEGVSRAARDLVRCRLAQRYIWLPRVLARAEWLPTDADWTPSAATLRGALAAPERRAGMDWRGYYCRAEKSPNMENRTRILRAVKDISHMLGHCGCGDQADINEPGLGVSE